MWSFLQVDVVVGPASEGIAKLAAQGTRFDLAFLDADKTGYLGYYNQVCHKPLQSSFVACMERGARCHASSRSLQDCPFLMLIVASH